VTSLADAVGQTLSDCGVRHAFGVVGNGNMSAVTALTDHGVRYLSARHEGGAIAMADAYYRTTGEPAVCTTTFGPGLTNAATGLADAVKQASGVLLLCGDAPSSGARRIDIDQAAFAASLGVPAFRLTDLATVRADTAAALETARSGPGPVMLSLPVDLMDAPVPEETSPLVPRAGRRPAARPEPARVEVVRRALQEAERPLLLAGLGAWRSGAGKLLADLADRTGALLATTVMASGLFAGNPWCLGVCGNLSGPEVASVVGDADLVVAFGAGLNEWTLHGGSLLGPDTRLVQIGTGARATSDRVDEFIAADASETASALLDSVSGAHSAPDTWRARTTGLRPGTPGPHEDAGTADRIDPRTLSAALAGLLPAERTLVTDGGHFVGWPWMYWPVPDPSAAVFTGAAFQSIGLGLAGAVGAAVGRSDRTTVAALGDGGALMGLPDLETLVRAAHSALVVVYNDAAYAAEVHRFAPTGAALDSAVFEDCDFAGVARALGAEAVTVRRTEDLAPVRAWRDRGYRGVLLLDCRITREVVGEYWPTSHT